MNDFRWISLTFQRGQGITHTDRADHEAVNFLHLKIKWLSIITYDFVILLQRPHLVFVFAVIQLIYVNLGTLRNFYASSEFISGSNINNLLLFFDVLS